MADGLLDAKAVLSRVFGHDRFRPGQSAAVFSVLRGRDTLVVLPTGGGKSLCYQVPAIVLPGLTVVVSPLISLMQDQVRALRARGVSAAFITSSQSSAEARENLQRAGRGDLKLLYVSPERFDQTGVTAALSRSRLALLAIDEAHCISRWGHDFRPSYRRLFEVRCRLGSPAAIALTATATPDVRADITSQLRLRRPTVIVTGFDRPNLAYAVLPARTDALKAPIIRRAIARADGPAIIYASTKRTVDRIRSSLRGAGIHAGSYHAGLSSIERKDVQNAFMAGDTRVIVATNAFGMGIDKPDVRLVVHHGMPGTLEAYYQEAGRAGRDGKHSRVLLLHSYADRFTHEFFIASSYPPRAGIEAVYLRLQQLADPHGFVAGGPHDLALARSEVKLSRQQIENAVRLLGSSGVLGVTPPDPAKVSVRLIATVARIREELSAPASVELELLRSLWRIRGIAIATGATIDLEALPRHFGGISSCTAILNSLQARQVLHCEVRRGGIQLKDRRAPLSKFCVDWAGADKRRRGEIAKLDMMQKYAFARGCRRHYLLRYFGEEARRKNCGMCDNCGGG